MTNAEGREAFIQACETMEHAEPVQVPMNGPVMIAGLRFRAVYDPLDDAVCFIPEGEWRKRLDKARAHKAAEEARVVRLKLEEGQYACVVAGRSVWRIGYDETVDDFVAIRSDKADR